MRNILIGVFIAATVILTSINTASAQDRKLDTGISFSSELQSNFGKKVNWANLLSLHAKYTPWNGGEFTIKTISTYKTRKERIIDDLQTFSNIEEDNMALNFSVAGYTHNFGRLSIFTGVRNVNEDYFTGDYTALFTNSSCGIYPILSVNLPIANYPVAGIGLHAEHRFSENWTIKNSLYNGIPGKLYGDEPSVFRIDPRSDGVLDIAEISYTSTSDNYGLYTLGGVYHSGYYPHKEGVSQKEKAGFAIWGSVEQNTYQSAYKEIGIIIQGSFAPERRDDCYVYFGGGMLLRGFLFSKRPDVLGVFVNRAYFTGIAETTVEITWKYEPNDIFSLQPTIQNIITGHRNRTIFLLRMTIDLRQ